MKKPTKKPMKTRRLLKSERSLKSEARVIANEAIDFMARVAPEYPGVDHEKCRLYFATRLIAGMNIGTRRGQFNAKTVLRWFEAEWKRTHGRLPRGNR